MLPIGRPFLSFLPEVRGLNERNRNWKTRKNLTFRHNKSLYMNNFTPRLCFHSRHRSSQRPISSLWSSRSARLSSEDWTWQRSSQNWHFTCWRRFRHISQLRKFVHTRNIRTIDWLLSITSNFLFTRWPIVKISTPHAQGEGVEVLLVQTLSPLEIAFVRAVVDPGQREDGYVLALNGWNKNEEKLSKYDPHVLKAPLSLVVCNFFS